MDEAFEKANMIQKDINDDFMDKHDINLTDLYDFLQKASMDEINDLLIHFAEKNIINPHRRKYHEIPPQIIAMHNSKSNVA